MGAARPSEPPDNPRLRHMRPTTKGRVPSEASDAIGLIITLLVRYPEIATIVSHPKDGTLTLSFAVTGALERATDRDVRDHVIDHVRVLLDLGRETPGTLDVACETDIGMSFVRITRDASTFSREELQMLVAVLAEAFGEKLVRSPASDDEAFDDDGSADELVDYAIDALRDPTQQRSLVGFREEKRVLVYYVKARKKAKARART